MGAGQAAAEDGEILGEEIDHPPVHRAPAGDDAVAGDAVVGHAELGGAVLDEHVELLEGAFVQQEIDTFACGQLALGVLGCNPALAAALAGLLSPVGEFVEDMLHARSAWLAQKRLDLT